MNLQGTSGEPPGNMISDDLFLYFWRSFSSSFWDRFEVVLGSILASKIWILASQTELLTSKLEKNHSWASKCRLRSHPSRSWGLQGGLRASISLPLTLQISINFGLLASWSVFDLIWLPNLVGFGIILRVIFINLDKTVS